MQFAAGVVGVEQVHRTRACRGVDAEVGWNGNRCVVDGQFHERVRVHGKVGMAVQTLFRARCWISLVFIAVIACCSCQNERFRRGVCTDICCNDMQAFPRCAVGQVGADLHAPRTAILDVRTFEHGHALRSIFRHRGDRNSNQVWVGVGDAAKHTPGPVLLLLEQCDHDWCSVVMAAVVMDLVHDVVVLFFIRACALRIRVPVDRDQHEAAHQQCKQHECSKLWTDGRIGSPCHAPNHFFPHLIFRCHRFTRVLLWSPSIESTTDVKWKRLAQEAPA